MYVLSKKQMYQCDHYTINEIGIPGAELMENAGKNCSLFIHNEILNSPADIIVFCGHGNNGGDGFVIARYLKQWGHNPQIVITGNPDKMSPETSENYKKCLDLNIKSIVCYNNDDWSNAHINVNNFDIIVDAIFGIGINGDVKGWISKLIEEINNSDVLKISIDIASGLDADNGLSNCCVMTDYTLTMAAYKFGHILDMGRKFSGETFVIDIGIPPHVFDHFNIQNKVVSEENITYPKRSPFSHKGDYGRIAVIAGSPGYSGAAIMACKAALRAGAGLITLFHPKGMDCIFETSLIEVMTKQIPDDIDELLKLVCIYDALLIGPGIGVNKSNQNILKSLMQEFDKPMIIDADAVSLISENPELKSLIKGKLITPHLGEFSRLTGKSIAERSPKPNLRAYSAILSIPTYSVPIVQ